MRFASREEAGSMLAKKLKENVSLEDAVVLGIARGGVAVAAVIADALNLPLGFLVIKKIGAPSNPEFSIGAAGPEKTVFWEKDFSKRVKASLAYRKQQSQVKIQEQQNAEKLFQSIAKQLDLYNKTVLVVDDGVATGATVLCAQKYLAKKHAKKTILVAPVIANDTYKRIKKYFTMIIALEVTGDFRSVGSFYENFVQVEDEQVLAMLAKSNMTQYN